MQGEWKQVAEDSLVAIVLVDTRELLLVGQVRQHVRVGKAVNT